MSPLHNLTLLQPRIKLLVSSGQRTTAHYDSICIVRSALYITVTWLWMQVWQAADVSLSPIPSSTWAQRCERRCPPHRSSWTDWAWCRSKPSPWPPAAPSGTAPTGTWAWIRKMSSSGLERFWHTTKYGMDSNILCTVCLVLKEDVLSNRADLGIIRHEVIRICALQWFYDHDMKQSD